MRVLCEVVISDILPTLRSLITRELIKSYKLSQIEVSKKLGITQPAISQYSHGLRGSKAKMILANKELRNEIKRLSQEIAQKNYSLQEIHQRICQLSEKLIAQKIYAKEIIFPGPCALRQK